jgi:hypothetical protein
MHRYVEQNYVSESVWQIYDSEFLRNACTIENIATTCNGPQDEDSRTMHSVRTGQVFHYRVQVYGLLIGIQLIGAQTKNSTFLFP